MDINATLIGQAIWFAIFIWFTMKFVWPPLQKAIGDRQKQIADGLAAGGTRQARPRARLASRRGDFALGEGPGAGDHRAGGQARGADRRGRQGSRQAGRRETGGWGASGDRAGGIARQGSVACAGRDTGGDRVRRRSSSERSTRRRTPSCCRRSAPSSRRTSWLNSPPSRALTPKPSSSSRSRNPSSRSGRTRSSSRRSLRATTA